MYIPAGRLAGGEYSFLMAHNWRKSYFAVKNTRTVYRKSSNHAGNFGGRYRTRTYDLSHVKRTL